MRTFVLTLALGVPAAALASPFALEGSRRPESARLMAPAPDGSVLMGWGASVVRVDPATRAVIRSYSLPDPDDEAWLTSVAALGDDVLVGVPQTLTSPEDARFGAVYLLDGTTGAVRHIFTSPAPPTPPGGHSFGATVAAHDGDVLVGALRESAVYRFDGATGVLEQTYLDPSPPDDPFVYPFGTTVLGIGDAVIVAAPAAFAVHVFDAASGALRRTIPDPRPAGSLHSFGTALAALGDDLLVGGPLAAPGDSAVWLFDPGTGWRGPSPIRRRRSILSSGSAWPVSMAG